MKQSTIAQKLNLQQLIHNIKILNQQSDISHQQQFNPYLNNDQSLQYSTTSINKQYNNNSYHNISHSNSNKLNTTYTGILHTDIQNNSNIKLVQICRKQTHSQWAYGQRNQQPIAQLKEINRKLLQDNKMLLKQCIRLRKILKNKANIQEISEIQDRNIGNINSQLKNIQIITQLNHFKIQNIQLKLAGIVPNNHSNNYVNNQKQLDKIVLQINKLKELQNRIMNKIQQLMQKQKDRNSKLTTSNTTTFTTLTTMASRTQQYDNNRIIKNMKLVYNDKIKDLQRQVMFYKDQLIKYRSNFGKTDNKRYTNY